jgi:hypothetical protein
VLTFCFSSAPQEGLVHLSNISSTKRGGSAKDMVGRGELPRGLDPAAVTERQPS